MKLGKIGAINAPQAEPISLRCYTGNYRPVTYSSHNQNANNGMMLTLPQKQLQTNIRPSPMAHVQSGLMIHCTRFVCFMMRVWTRRKLT